MTNDELENAKRHGYILAMRLLQSDLPKNDEEQAAIDYFVTREQIKKMVNS